MPQKDSIRVDSKVTFTSESMRTDDSGSTLSWRARLRHWTGLDRAIGFTVLARLWSALAGVVSVLLIARFLTPYEQGYYYTFFSFMALQVIFELGFSFVVLQCAAHEHARLSITPDGTVDGDPIAHARLASVLQKTMRWYAVAATLMVATLLPAGLYFFGRLGGTDVVVAWKSPWFLLVAATVVTFPLNPACAFVEGCGFVPQMARMRLIQALFGSVLAWTALAARHGLFSPGLLIGANAIVQLWVLSRSKFRRLLTGLLRYDVTDQQVVWRNEIWPFQWRIAVTWLCSYFIWQMFNPILFALRGPVAAGRMGMSLSIASSIGAVGLAWMSTKAAPFGTMIARGETHKLDRLFFRTLWQSTALIAAAAAVIFFCLVTIVYILPRLAARVLSPWAFALLLLTTIMSHVVSSEALYLRAHKREPFLVQALTMSICISISTVVLARAAGANAVTIGYFLFGGVASLVWGTYLFVTKRREWHGCSAISRKRDLASSQLTVD